MTVRELRNLLERLPDNLHVYVKEERVLTVNVVLRDLEISAR